MFRRSRLDWHPRRSLPRVLSRRPLVADHLPNFQGPPWGLPPGKDDPRASGRLRLSPSGLCSFALLRSGSSAERRKEQGEVGTFPSPHRERSPCRASTKSPSESNRHSAPACGGPHPPQRLLALRASARRRRVPPSPKPPTTVAWRREKPHARGDPAQGRSFFQAALYAALEKVAACCHGHYRPPDEGCGRAMRRHSIDTPTGAACASHALPGDYANIHPDPAQSQPCTGTAKFT